jgi:hypothetical protein
MDLVTRKQAIENGESRYFTGKPCKRGHISERYVNNSSCLSCAGAGEGVNYHRWTSDDIAKLRIMSKDKTMEQAAEAIGCSRAAVYGRAKAQGISFMKYGELNHGTKYPDSVVIRCIEMAESGMRKSTVARIMGVERTSIYKWCDGSRGVNKMKDAEK